MNWSIRYATTEKSISEVNSVLPEGWLVHNFGEAGESMWSPHDTSGTETAKSSLTPGIIRAHNPKTGNSLFLLDHNSLAHESEDSRREFWNPIDHADYIKRAAEHVDKLGSNISLHMARSSKYNSRYDQENMGGWYPDKDGSQMLHIQKPTMFINREYSSNILLKVITHEYGHSLTRNGNTAGSVNPRIESISREYYNSLRLRNQERNEQSILERTSPTEYGKKSWGENAAEHYALYKLNLSHKSNCPPLTKWLGETMGWGKTITDWQS